MVLQLVASLALLRALYVILGWRPVLLVPLSFALFSPLGLPAYAWWAAALNALPMVAAMAWVCADAILLIRTGNQRYAITGTAVFGLGLLFFEKAAVIPFVAFAITALLAYVLGDRAAVKTVWRGGSRLWIASLTLVVAWAGLYLLVVDQRRWTLDPTMTVELVIRSVTHGIVPGLIGGPWTWERWAPSSPWALPGVAVMIVGWVVLLAVFALTVTRKEHAKTLWLAAAGYAIACQVPIYLMRSSRFTAIELAQTLRYLPDLMVVLALLAAIGCCAPNRVDAAWLDASRLRTGVIAAGAALFALSSGFSTFTFVKSWHDNPTRAYVGNVLTSLAAANAATRAPLLEQEVDPLILQRFAWPENLFGHVFDLVRDRPEFSTSTTDLRTFDRKGSVGACAGHLGPAHPRRTKTAVRLPRSARRPGPHAAGRADAPHGVDGRDQLPGQQRRFDDVRAVRRRRDQGPRASGTQPRVRPTVRGGECHLGPGQHLGTVGLPGLGSGRLRRAAVGLSGGSTPGAASGNRNPGPSHYE